MSEYMIFCCLRIISGAAQEHELEDFHNEFGWHGNNTNFGACTELASVLARLNQDPNA